jgi:hypothetical protein
MPRPLVARIEASVRGKSNAHFKRRGFTPRRTSIIRALVLLTIAAAVGGTMMKRRKEARELASDRAALLDDLRTRIAASSDFEKGFIRRAESWLALSAVSYDGDLLASSVVAPGALQGLLARPLVYVRGPIASFADAGGVARAAAESSRDPLLTCLLDPPASRTEKALFPKVRATYTGADAPATAYRLEDIEAGLPVLLPPWAAQVQSAKTFEELWTLRKELGKAPTERATKAMKATVLVFSVDEPNDGDGPTELDGEHRHAVRVGIVDLAAGAAVLRIRKVVDPSWISTLRRSEYALGLDSCALAVDVLDAVHAAGGANSADTGGRPPAVRAAK